MAIYCINADTGNDTTGNGSASLPWLTMSKAHTSATTGDIVIPQPAVNVYTFASITFGKSLTIRAGNIGDAVFDGTAGAAAWTTGVYSLTLENLIFQNITTNALGMLYLSGTASRNILIYNCIFRNIVLGLNNNNSSIITNLAPASQITQNVLLVACAFENITTPYSAIDTQIATVANNSTSNGSAINFRMINCGVYIPAATHPLKNIVQLVYPAGGDTLAMDNVILDNLSGGTVNFAVYYGASASTYDRIYRSCFHNITGAPNAFTNGVGNITSAPAYADVAGGDYRLQPNSVGSFEGGLI